MTADLKLLPSRMRSKVAIQLCPDPYLPGYCWAWTACINSKGYGCIAVAGKSQLAHRVSYELVVGPIPDGLQIDHLCRNTVCCNPDHLEPVTAKENIQRTARVNKDRCVNGHLLDEANLIVKRAGRYMVRNCRECTNARKRANRKASA